MKDQMRITFDVENAAFFDEDGKFNTEEVSGTLMRIARKVRNGDDCGVIFDTNGNRIGDWNLDLPDETEGDEE